MYVRPESRKSITIPDNYGGSAFGGRSQMPLPPPEDVVPPEEEIKAPSEAIEVSSIEEKKGSLFSGIGSEELLLLGMILILSQSDEGSDILPFLLILLFFKGGK